MCKRLQQDLNKNIAEKLAKVAVGHLKLESCYLYQSFTPKNASNDHIMQNYQDTTYRSTCHGVNAVRIMQT